MAIEDLALEPFNYSRPGRAGDVRTRDEIEARLPRALPERLWRLIGTGRTPYFAQPNAIETLGSMQFLASGTTDIAVLLSRCDGAGSILRAMEDYAPRLKPGMVAFAEPSTGGDLLLLDMGEYRPGAVFFWWHEGPGTEDSDESLCLVAETFDEFCDRIGPAAEAA